MKNIAVYTVIMGKYDKLLPINPKFRDEADFYLFTDFDIKTNDYIKIKVKAETTNLRRESRKYKISYFKYLSNYKYTIYLDGSIEMLISPLKAVNKYLNGYNIAVHRHPWRDCIYIEAKECIRIGLINAENVKKQLTYYRMMGYPDNYGLTENGVIIRRNTPGMKEFCKFWQLIYDRHTQRDQLCFCFCAWRLRMKYNIIDNTLREIHGKPKEFKLYEHL